MHGLVEKVGLRHVWVGPVEQREAVCVCEKWLGALCVTAGSAWWSGPRLNSGRAIQRQARASSTRASDLCSS